MAFLRWDPLGDLLTLHERLERFTTSEAPGWRPPVDIYETADHYVVTAEVPGLSREDIDIRLHDGRLTLRGTRGTTGNVRCEQYHRVERGHGTFLRTFALPLAIDVNAIKADLRDGVLTVTVPKASDTNARRITVA